MFMPGTTPEQAAQNAPIMATQMQAMSRAAFDAQQAAGLLRLVKTQAYIPILKAWGQTSDQTTVATVMGEMLAADLRSDLTEISAEITVLAAYDKAMGLPVSRLEGLYAEQYKSAPMHNVRVVEDSFRFIMVDQKDVFLNILQDTLMD